ncbi:MAG: helix-turn-helix domain-containing protein, partial [Bauldia sp.]|nr:helix-turn-helix domain-containing protein [Bauldia sp.]
MDEKAAIGALAALAQPTRLAVFRQLVGRHPGGIAAGDIARRFDVPHNTMSSHLAVLTRAGLARAERDGRTIAEAQARRAAAASDFLLDVFSAVDPGKDGRDVKMADALARAARD